MPDVYRAYFLQAGGHINRPPIVLDAGDDEAAIAAARQLVDGHDVEIWHGKRLVKLLPKHSAE